jgi:hypothetical protein
MSYGVPGIPGVPGPVRSVGKDVDSARLDERTLDEAARRHEMGEEAKHHEQEGSGFFRRLFRRRSDR